MNYVITKIYYIKSTIKLLIYSLLIYNYKYLYYYTTFGRTKIYLLLKSWLKHYLKTKFKK